MLGPEPVVGPMARRHGPQGPSWRTNAAVRSYHWSDDRPAPRLPALLFSLVLFVSGRGPSTRDPRRGRHGAAGEPPPPPRLTRTSLRARSFSDDARPFGESGTPVAAAPSNFILRPSPSPRPRPLPGPNWRLRSQLAPIRPRAVGGNAAILSSYQRGHATLIVAGCLSPVETRSASHAGRPARRIVRLAASPSRDSPAPPSLLRQAGPSPPRHPAGRGRRLPRSARRLRIWVSPWTLCARTSSPTASQEVVRAVDARYARTKRGSAPSRTRAVIEGAVVLAVGAILVVAESRR